MTARRSRIAVGTGAVLVGGLCLWRDRHGVRLTSDGWALWEASVSLLERGTFAYLDGTPVTFWPPLPAVMLAATQGLLGVSGRAIAWFLAVVTATGWLGWWSLAREALLPVVDLPPARRHALLAAVAALSAASCLWAGTTLLAHVVLLALLPWWLLAVLAAAARSSRPAQLAVAGLGTSLLLTHHTAAVLLPWAALLLARGQPRRAAAARLVPLAAPVVAWALARVLLGQTSSHPLHPGGRAGLGGNALHLVRGVGELVWPTSHEPLQLLAGAALLAATAAVALGSDEPARPREAARAGLSALAGLFALFNVVYVWDALRNRFVLFFPLLALPVVVGRVARTRSPLAFALALSLVVGAAAAPAARWAAGDVADPASRPRDELARSSDWISTRPPGPGESGRVTPPPRPPDPDPARDLSGDG